MTTSTRTHRAVGWLRSDRDYGRARTQLDGLVADAFAQAEEVDALVRDLWDVPPVYGELLWRASERLVDTAMELASVRDRMARYERSAA